MSLLLTRGRRVNRNGYVCPAGYYTASAKSNIVAFAMHGAGDMPEFRILETTVIPDEIAHTGRVSRLMAKLAYAHAAEIGFTAHEAIRLMVGELDREEDGSSPERVDDWLRIGA